MHRAVHFKCKDMDFQNKLQMNDDETEAMFFAQTGLATEHLLKLITINDTIVTFLSMI